VLGILARALLGSRLLVTLIERLRGSVDRVVRTRALAVRVLILALVVLVVFMTPAQFQGQGNESKFLLPVRNTLLVSGLTGALAILVSTTAGYAMARLRFPDRFQTLFAITPCCLRWGWSTASPD